MAGLPQSLPKRVAGKKLPAEKLGSPALSDFIFIKPDVNFDDLL